MFICLHYDQYSITIKIFQSGGLLISALSSPKSSEPPQIWRVCLCHCLFDDKNKQTNKHVLVAR